MANRNLIAQQWLEFQKKVLPPTASAVQRIETRRAFYAGAQSLFGSILANLTSGNEAEPEDLSMLDDIQSEFNDYAEQLKRGVA